MKVMKKALALLLALATALSMLSITAFADNTTNPGSITISNAVVGKDYSAYKVLDLVTDNDTKPTAFKYTLNSNWSGLTSYTDNSSSFTTFFTTDATDSHLEKVTTTYSTDDDWAKAFAQYLKAYLESDSGKSISATSTTTASSGTVTMSNLEMGYYFVTSSLGSVCSLDTTTPAAAIEEKNSAPTAVKTVEEGSTYGATNDAGIGDTVTFQTTISVVDGQPDSYVLHDVMSSGLTFDASNGITSVKVSNSSTTPSVTAQDVSAASSNTDRYYTLKSGSNVSESANPKCTFEMEFYNIQPNDVITVTYTATVNSNAVDTTSATDGYQTNEAKLSYKDISNLTQTTTPDVTKTYTWSLPIYKYTDSTNNTNVSQETPLAGAKFILSKTVSETTYYATFDTSMKLTGWTTEKTGATEISSGNDGKITVYGLDAGTYSLTETEAPAGYNKLANPIPVTISSTEDSTNETRAKAIKYTWNSSETTADENGVKVINTTGVELPGTGGAGTVAIYVIGGVLVLGGVVVLITKLRLRKSKG